MKWTSGAELSEDDHRNWKKHYDNLCDKALKIQAEGKNACVSFVAYKEYVRDHIRSRIPDVKIIHIQVDVEILLPKNKIRITKALA